MGLKEVFPAFYLHLVCCTLNEEEANVFIEKTQETKLSQALYGLSRTLVANMVTGVSKVLKKDYKLLG